MRPGQHFFCLPEERLESLLAPPVAKARSSSQRRSPKRPSRNDVERPYAVASVYGAEHWRGQKARGRVDSGPGRQPPEPYDHGVWGRMCPRKERFSLCECRRCAASVMVSGVCCKSLFLICRRRKGSV